MITSKDVSKQFNLPCSSLDCELVNGTLKNSYWNILYKNKNKNILTLYNISIFVKRIMYPTLWNFQKYFGFSTPVAPLKDKTNKQTNEYANVLNHWATFPSEHDFVYNQLTGTKIIQKYFEKNEGDSLQNKFKFFKGFPVWQCEFNLCMGDILFLAVSHI